MLRLTDDPNNDDFSVFSVSEERFLTNLHSLDSNRLAEFWPWDFNKLSEDSILRKGEQPNPPTVGEPTPGTEIGSIGDYFNNGKPSEEKKVEHYQSRRSLWADYNIQRRHGKLPI